MKRHFIKEKQDFLHQKSLFSLSSINFWIFCELFYVFQNLFLFLKSRIINQPKRCLTFSKRCLCENKIRWWKITKYDENSTKEEKYEYDLKSGWILKITQSKFVDGNEVEFLVAESIEIISNPPEDENEDDQSLPSLTPIPLWPTLLFLLGAASIYRKKRWINNSSLIFFKIL